MNPPSRFEIEQFANERFQAGLDRRINEYAQKQARALAEARARRNAGGYLPALIRCKQESLRAEILALADAWVEAGTLYAVPLQAWAEKALEEAAGQMAAGAISGLRGELNLMAKRTRNPHCFSDDTGAGPREIGSAMKSTLREAKLRLKTQRIQTERSVQGDSASPQRGADVAQVRPHPEAVTAGTPGNNSGTWPRIRADFESLPSGEYSFFWNSVPPVSFFGGIQLLSHWSFHQPKDPSLRERVRAIMLRAARARGYDSEDGWLDDLRNRNFVNFKISGSGRQPVPDGTYVHFVTGILHDAVKHSITLCHMHEAESATRAAITEFAQPTQAIIPNPRIKRRGRGPIRDYKTAARVAEVVARVAPDGRWRSNLDDVLSALDDERVPTPKTWASKHGYRNWYSSISADTAGRGRHMAIEAIKHHLKRAKEAPPETIP